MTQRSPTTTPGAVAVVAQKGGQGKSTVTMNVAHELARRNHDVVVVDLDINGHLTSDLGYMEWAKHRNKHYGSFVADTKPEVELKDILLQTGKGWHFVPCMPKATYDEWETHLWEQAETPAEAIKPLFDALDMYYDFILIDTPPTKSNLLVGALEAIDHCMIPIQVGDGEEVLKHTVKDLIEKPASNSPESDNRADVLATFPTKIRQGIRRVTDPRELIETLCESPSVKKVVPNFAFINQELFDEIDAGNIDPVPRPGIRYTVKLKQTDPLREVDSSNEQLACFEELARIVERGHVDRSNHPYITQDGVKTSPRQTRQQQSRGYSRADGSSR